MKNIVILICAACLFHYAAFGQNQRVVDSLNAVLEMKTGGDRYSPLYELAFEYLDKDNEKALVFIEQAEQAALLSGDSLWIVKSKRVRGQILYKLERSDECVPLFENALAIAERNNFTKEYMMISNSAGIAYMYRNRFDKALISLVRSMEMAEQEKDSAYLSTSLNNIGLIYYHLNDFRKALNFLLRCVDVRKRIANAHPFDPFINISLSYAYLKEYDKARKYLQMSTNDCGENCMDGMLMHRGFASGLIYYGLDEYQNAKAQFLVSLRMARKEKNTRVTLDNISYISKILIKEGNLRQANLYLKEAEGIINKGVPFPDQMLVVYSGFCDLYESLKNYRKLAVYQSKYIELNDSIYSNKLTSRLMTAEAEFTQRENSAKIAAQSEIILLKEDIIKRQMLLSGVVGILCLLTLAFSIFIFGSLRQKKDANALLERRIRERTSELELNREALLKAIYEKDLWISRATGLISDSVGRVEGLCSTARMEIHDPKVRLYLQKISTTQAGMANRVKSVLDAAVVVPVI